MLLFNGFKGGSGFLAFWLSFSFYFNLSLLLQQPVSEIQDGELEEDVEVDVKIKRHRGQGGASLALMTTTKTMMMKGTEH